MSDKPGFETRRLLELMEAASTKADPTESLEDVSPELSMIIDQYVMSLIGEFDSLPGESSPEEFDKRFQQLLAAEPRGVFLLRARLAMAGRIAAQGPVSDDVIFEQMKRLKDRESRHKSDFAVLRRRGSLSYLGTAPARITQSFEMARSARENTTRLQHTQRLNHCEVMVTVETSSGNTFSMTLEFSYIDPQFQRSNLILHVAGESDSTALMKSLTESSGSVKIVEFEHLPADRYVIQILADTTLIDQFRAELKLEEQT